MKDLTALIESTPKPVRFEIVHQRFFNVYGFEKDSTVGILWSTGHKTQTSARKRLDELEKYYGI